jgi:hypothetical protein
MAAVAAAVAMRAWEAGTWPRAGVVALLSFQVIWGSDVPFIRTHNQIFDSPFRHVAAWIPSGYEQRKNRLRPYEPMNTIGKATPANAVIVPHDMILSLGLDRNWVNDRFQSLIYYDKLRSPAAIHAMYKSLGVTHLVWSNGSVAWDSIAGDLAFLNYALRYTEGRQDISGYHVAKLPERAPVDARTDYAVLSYSCPNRKSWQHLSNLQLLPSKTSNPEPLPQDLSPEHADFLVVDRTCNTKFKVPHDFQLGQGRNQFDLYVRKDPAPNAGPHG